MTVIQNNNRGSAAVPGRRRRAVPKSQACVLSTAVVAVAMAPWPRSPTSVALTEIITDDMLLLLLLALSCCPL